MSSSSSSSSSSLDKDKRNCSRILPNTRTLHDKMTTPETSFDTSDETHCDRSGWAKNQFGVSRRDLRANSLQSQVMYSSYCRPRLQMLSLIGLKELLHTSDSHHSLQALLWRDSPSWTPSVNSPRVKCKGAKSQYGNHSTDILWPTYGSSISANNYFGE